MLAGADLRGARLIRATLVDCATAAVSGADSLIPELISGQSVIVYQTDSGKQILHVESLPVQRAGQTLTEIWESDRFTVAMLSVAVRAIRTLVAASSLPERP